MLKIRLIFLLGFISLTLANTVPYGDEYSFLEHPLSDLVVVPIKQLWNTLEYHRVGGFPVDEHVTYFCRTP